MPRIKNKLNWEIISAGKRMEVIEQLKGVISKNDGYVIYFNTFSDLAMTLTIEIEAKNIRNLHQGLQEIVTISSSLSDEIKMSEDEWWILLNVSFSKGEGNLTVDIPNVPG